MTDKEKLDTIEDLCQELVYENKGFVEEIPLILVITRDEDYHREIADNVGYINVKI